MGEKLLTNLGSQYLRLPRSDLDDRGTTIGHTVDQNGAWV